MFEQFKKFAGSIFIRNENLEQLSTGPERLMRAEIEAHLEVSQYGDFQLTEAIRPGFDLDVVPSAGYRCDEFSQDGFTVPVLMVSASKEYLFDLFLDLLKPLGFNVSVVLETSHASRQGEHIDLHREQIDLPVLESILCDHEDMITNDGCAGVAVFNGNMQCEVQLDEHKLLVIFGDDLHPFKEILAKYHVNLDPGMKFLTEGEHVHASSEGFGEEFDIMTTRLNVAMENDDGSYGEDQGE